MVNMMWRGTPSFSAQWMWAKLGGLAMIASATNGLEEPAVLAESIGPLSVSGAEMPSPVS